MNNIKSFRSFTEARVKELVTTFGRFQPPHLGHAKLLNKVVELAKGKTYRIYTSQTEDNKQNPLNYEDKIKFIRKMFPSYGRNILLDNSIKNVLDIAKQAYDDGFSKLTLVVGSDRVSEFKKLLDKYNGVKSAHGYYEFKDGIDVKSAGERDPDSDAVEGVSASKMRAAASENDIETFTKGLPSDFSDVKELFNAVRKGMGLKESREFKKQVDLVKVSEQRERYVAGELFKVGSRVLSLKNPGAKYTITECHSNYVVCSNAAGLTAKFFIADLCEDQEPITIVDRRVVRDGGSTEYIFSDGTSIWLDRGMSSKTKGAFFASWNDRGQESKIIVPPPGYVSAINREEHFNK